MSPKSTNQESNVESTPVTIDCGENQLQKQQTEQLQHNFVIGGDNESSHHDRVHFIHHESKDKRSPRYILFRLGALRFGVHGCMGIISTVLLLYALILVRIHNHSSTNSTVFIPPSWLALSIVITTSINAIGSYGLLSQVPASTKIASWIIPPHREAFKRTIAVVGYLNLRMMHLMGWFNLPLITSEAENDWSRMLFPIGMFLYNLYFFFPYNSSLKNGNTWVFVLPMWIAFNFETLHQFPSFSTSFQSQTSLFPIPMLLYQSVSWDKVNEWNQSVVNLPYILITQFCTLQVAFMFTLAFRGIISIHKCYWIAATVVGMLSIRLFSI